MTEQSEHTEQPEQSYSSAQISFVALIVAVFLASAMYRVLASRQLQHTSLVFIGIPTLIAIAVTLFTRPKSATGVICKAITLSLALAGILAGEGFVCILFASPLFYLVGIGIGLIVDTMQRHGQRQRQVRMSVLVLGLLGPSSLEGVVPGFEFAREAAVTRTRIVAGTASDVEATLARAPRFDRAVPEFFRLGGFPMPGLTSGEGLAVGDERRIEFVHGQHEPGALVVRVTSHEPRHVTFTPVADDSHLVHWLSWRDIDVTWRELEPGRTEVSWTLRYRRRLDPAWYFAPLERFGVGLAAGYLIDTLATPGAQLAAGAPRRADAWCITDWRSLVKADWR